MFNATILNAYLTALHNFFIGLVSSADKLAGQLVGEFVEDIGQEYRESVQHLRDACLGVWRGTI